MLICYATSQSSKGRMLFPNWCKAQNIEVVEIFSKQELDKLIEQKPDLLISDRFSSIFDNNWLATNEFPKFNVHPSLLPLHRGSFPIFWSALLDSDWGVTIHEINSGIDEGPIVKQIEIPYQETWSFQDLYNLYRLKTQELLREIVMDLCAGRGFISSPQPEIKGKVHKIKDSKPLVERLRNGWDTPIIAARTDFAREISNYLGD